MKRISFLLVTLGLGCALVARAQDAATQERLDKLAGEVQNLTEAQAALKKQISELSRELESVREQVSRPSASYARPEDLNRLEADIKAVDRKRMEDADKVRSELAKLRDLLRAPITPQKQRSTPTSKETSSGGGSTTPEKGFEYVVQSGDTLDAIALAYREKNIKITVAQILKANPGLKAERLKVGQKIFIPAPQ